MKLLIMELDGTLIHPREKDHEYIRGSNPEETGEREKRGLKARSIVSDIELPDFAYEKLRYYKRQGWDIVVMTNQPLVAMGKRTIDEVYSIFYATNHLLGGLLTGLLICPNDPNAVVEAYRKDDTSKEQLLNVLLREMKMKKEDIEECVIVSHLEDDYHFAAYNGFKFRLPSEFL